MHAASGWPTLEGLLACEDVAFVRTAYRLMLGREVDAEGLGNYLEQLADGLPREHMLATLSLSREGRVHAAAGHRGDPDTRLREQVFAFASPTAATLDALLAHRDAAFVHCAYQVLLGRDADVPGARECIARLREGASQWRILDALRASREYAACAAARRAVRERDFDAHASKSPLRELFAQPDEAFAIGAHLLMTGRKPAPAELAAQLGRVSPGPARTDLLCELAESDGGRELRALLERLEQMLRRQSLATWPVVGRWLAVLLGLEGESRAEMRLRRIENELHRLSAGSGNALRPTPRPEPPPRLEPAANEARAVLKPHASVAPRLVSLDSRVGKRGGERGAR